MSTEMTIILGIESSCDDTGAAILKNGKILANVIAGQEVHSKYGGVVPELASRAHQKNILPTVSVALDKAGVDLKDLTAIAYTRGPGLMGSLLVGISFAKSLAMSLGIPSIAVDHMKGHVLSQFISSPEDPEDKKVPRFPFLSLIVSGGHTQLVMVHAPDNMELIGKTLDDAAGEAFDKTAKMLGLPYPGGPVIDKLAREGRPVFEFNKPKVQGLDMSFSGLKTSILRFLQKELKSDPDFISSNMNDICASVQRCITEILMDKLSNAIEQYNPKDISLAGGVAANSEIRGSFMEIAEEHGVEGFIPEFQYCTDNAAMIAMVGHFDLDSQNLSGLDVNPKSNLSL